MPKIPGCPARVPFVLFEFQLRTEKTIKWENSLIFYSRVSVPRKLLLRFSALRVNSGRCQQRSLSPTCCLTVLVTDGVQQLLS